MRLRTYLPRPFVIVGLSLAVAAVSVLAVLPAFGNSAESATIFSGTSSGEIVLSVNKGSGTAVEGSTGTVSGGTGIYGVGSGSLTSSTAIHGRAFGPSSTAVLADALNTNKSAPSYGVYATSQSGCAVFGYSPATHGIYGKTTAGGTSISTFHAGVFGVDASANVIPNYHARVAGQSTWGPGVVGVTNNANTSNGLGAVVGRDFGPSGTNNSGLEGDSTYGLGVNANTSSSSFPAVEATNRGGGPLIWGFNGTSVAFQVKNNGDVYGNHFHSCCGSAGYLFVTRTSPERRSSPMLRGRALPP